MFASVALIEAANPARYSCTTDFKRHCTAAMADDDTAALYALTPLDGSYAGRVSKIRDYFSEAASSKRECASRSSTSRASRK